MGHESIITNWKFDTKHLSRELRFEAWSDAMSGCGKYREHENSKRSDIWQSNLWSVGPLLLTSNMVGAFRGKRDPEVLRRTNFEHVSLRYVIQGKHNAIFREDAAPMRDGEVHLYNMNVPYYSETPTELSSVVVILPYSSIGYDPSVHPSHIGLDARSPACIMVKNALLQFRDNLTNLNEEQAPAVLRGFCGLLKGVFFPNLADDETRKEMEKAKFSLVRDFIERNIHDPAIGTEQLCGIFGISRAQIYRMFAEERGVASYINRRRMIHAFRQIGSIEPTRGAIRSVAEKFGYYDQGHFSRQFRNNFNIAPRDILGEWRDNGEEFKTSITDWGAGHAQYVEIADNYWGLR